MEGWGRGNNTHQKKKSQGRGAVADRIGSFPGSPSFLGFFFSRCWLYLDGKGSE